MNSNYLIGLIAIALLIIWFNFGIVYLWLGLAGVPWILYLYVSHLKSKNDAEKIQRIINGETGIKFSGRMGKSNFTNESSDLGNIDE